MTVTGPYRKAYDRNSTAGFIYHAYLRDFAQRGPEMLAVYGGRRYQVDTIRRGRYLGVVTVFFDYQGRTVLMLGDDTLVDVTFIVEYPEPLPLCRNCGEEVDPWVYHLRGGEPYYRSDGTVERGYCHYRDRGYYGLTDTEPTEDARVHGFSQPVDPPPSAFSRVAQKLMRWVPNNRD